MASAMAMPSPVVPTVSVDMTFSSRVGSHFMRISRLPPKPPDARTKALPVNSNSSPAGFWALTAATEPSSFMTNSVARMLR